MPVNDIHCHFLSARFFETLGNERVRVARPPSAADVANELGMEPPASPDLLADRWVFELDRNHVSRAALIASVPGDEESVAAAVHPTKCAAEFARHIRRYSILAEPAQHPRVQTSDFRFFRQLR